MSLLFKEIREIISPYSGRAGKCATAVETAVFARQVMQYLLHEGSSAGLRKVCILAHRGYLSLPPEVELPIKAKIDHKVASIWNKHFSFHSVNENFDSCPPIGEVLIEDGSQTPLAYNLPNGGSIIGVMGHCDEAADAAIIVQGKDQAGREIYTNYKGDQVVGEKLLIRKNTITYGQVSFGEVTAVLKPKTEGYVSLWAVNPAKDTTQFLADYNPSEERPLYRKFRVASRGCPDIVHISMLCRVRLKDNYHDNEITFFDNSFAILLAAQRIQAEINNDLQTAGFKKAAIEDNLNKESSYKKIAGSPLDVYFPLSGGIIKGLF